MKTIIKKAFPKLFYSLKANSYAKKAYLSQVGQDFWVSCEVFNQKKNGFFVEIGSVDGTSYSNTFILEKRYAWKGICIEANPDFFEELNGVRSAVCINRCISSKEGKLSFLKDSVCGRVIDHEEGLTEDVIEVAAIPLHLVLADQKAPKVIDYLSIDVEGHEDDVLLDFPFDRYRFNCITIERPSQLLRARLEEFDYVIVREVAGLDVFYVHQKFLTEYSRNLFAYWAGCASG